MIPTSVIALLASLAAYPTPKSLVASAERALPLLLKSAKGHTDKQTCFACHNQAMPLLALRAAKDRGFTVAAEDFEEQTEFIADFLGRNKSKFRKGEGTGGQVDTAGYALFALELGGRTGDDITEAVVEYLLKYQSDTGHWRVVSNRPPTEASNFTTNYLALRGLRMFAPEIQKEAIAKRSATVLAWVLKNEPKDTEDRVFRLLSLKELGASADEIRKAREALLKTQHRDGSWGQLADLAGDAYATGSALVALRWAGDLATSDVVYRRGLWYLLRTQLADGSWRVRSRSRPFQPYYETGFPHGRDQFISTAASGWATTAIIEACEKKTASN